MKYDFSKLEKWQKIGIACLLVIVPGIIGWIVEFLFYYHDHGVIMWKGGNFLPWINMYSFGAFLMVACTYKHRDKPLRVFLISVVSAGIFELLTGFIIDKCFGVRFWDYHNEFLDLNGYICLLSLVCFGIGGLFLTYCLIPFFIKLSNKIPKKIFLIVTISLCAIILVDEIYNFFFTKIFDLPTALEIYGFAEF